MADPNEEMLKVLRSIDARLGRVEDEQKMTRLELGERLDKLEVHARATNESVTATNTRLDRMESRLIGVEEAAMSTNAALRNVEKGLATLHEDMLAQGAKLTTIGGELAGLRQEAAKDLAGLHDRVTKLEVAVFPPKGRPTTSRRSSPRR